MYFIGHLAEVAAGPAVALPHPVCEAVGIGFTPFPCLLVDDPPSVLAGIDVRDEIDMAVVGIGHPNTAGSAFTVRVARPSQGRVQPRDVLGLVVGPVRFSSTSRSTSASYSRSGLGLIMVRCPHEPCAVFPVTRPPYSSSPRIAE
jgi:hypothetical protein